MSQEITNKIETFTLIKTHLPDTRRSLWAPAPTAAAAAAAAASVYVNISFKYTFCF